MDFSVSPNMVIIIEFILYLAGMLAIGIYYSRKELSQADYHLGGKRVKGWALALSERATGESAWLILGLTGAAYSTGLSELWVVFGCVAGIVVSWIFLARKFRSEAEKYKCISFMDYFATRFPSHANRIRWLGSLLIIIFYTLYVYAQFEGGGKVLNQTFGLDPFYGILISAAVTIYYSMAGGFLAIVWTDVIQAILMAVTFLITPILAYYAVITQHLSLYSAMIEAGPKFSSFTKGESGFSAFILILGGLAWFFGYLGGQPPLSTRWMAMKDDEEVKKGVVVALIWTVLAYTGAVMIGLCALALFGSNVVKDPEMILPFMLMKMVPPWISGLLLVGAIAAMMSTASSQLLIITTSITEDIIHKLLGMKCDDKALVRISRITMISIGLLGLFLALFLGKPIFSIVSWAWAGIGCTFSPAVLLSFYWKRTSGAGIIGCLVTGLFVTFIWMLSPLGKLFSVMVATFLFSLVAGVIFSLLFPDDR